MKLLKYGKEYDLYVEVNNYLFFLNSVCENNKEVRRFTYRLCYLYEKLNELSFDDAEDSPEFLRNKRRSLLYAKEVKKNIKSIKAADISVFDKAAKKLVRNNLDVYNDSLRDYSRYIGLDADKISRVLSGDLSNLFSNKRLSILNNSIAKSTDMDENVEEIEKSLNVSDKSDSKIPEVSTRLLNKSELEQLKREIDSGDSLFVSLNSISFEQRDTINMYILLKKEFADFSLKLKELDEERSNLQIMDLYRKLYSIAGAMVNGMFEQVIHLSKVVSGNVLNYVMDRNVIEIFGIFSCFIDSIDDVVSEFENKVSNKLSNFERNELKQELWQRYKLCGVTSYDIKESLSFDILAFIIENPFTLFQVTKPKELDNSILKKYDLSILLEFVIPELAGTTVHVVKSLEKSIRGNNEYSEKDKESVLLYVKEIFSQKYVADLGVNQMPSSSYEYFVSFVIDEIYSNNKSLSEIKALRNELIDKIYDEFMYEYNEKNILDKLFGSATKPSYNEIREIIISFENKLLRNALKTIN